MFLGWACGWKLHTSLSGFETADVLGSGWIRRFAGGRFVGHVQLYNILLSVCHALGADYGQPLAVFIPKKCLSSSTSAHVRAVALVDGCSILAEARWGDTRTPLSHFSTLPLPLKVTNSSTTKVPFNESKERANHNRRGEVVRLLMSRDPPHELIESPSVFKGPL